MFGGASSWPAGNAQHNLVEDEENIIHILLNKHLNPCFLFRVMAEELTNARAALQRQTREAQGAIQDLLLEREDFSRHMMLTHRYHDNSFIVIK